MSATQPHRERIRVRGVRTNGAARVQLWSLRDGWAVFPDWDAAHRRWVAIGLVGVLLLFGAAPPLYKFVGGPGITVGVIAIAILAISRAGDARAQRRARREKKQMRFDAIHRAGGWDSIQWAASTGGRNVHTVGEMNIWLQAAGLDTAVISANAVTNAVVDRRRFSTTVTIQMDSDNTITYRARGRRAPTKLADLVTQPLGGKCTVSSATNQ